MLLALTLVPFQVGDGAGALVLLDPILLGWPLDVLLVTVALSLAATLGRGGTLLAFVLVFMVGTLGKDVALAPEWFGAAGPVLQVLEFPWVALKGLPEAVSARDWATFGMGAAKMLTYWGAWLAIGLGTLTIRTRRAGSAGSAPS